LRFLPITTPVFAFAIITILAVGGLTALAGAFVAGRRRGSGPSIALGVDLVEVADVAAALASPRAERYLALVYGEGERSDCTSDAGLEASRLAARFAAKEAVRKAIGADAVVLPWTSIQVERGSGGVPNVRLDERAAALARKNGLTRFALSLTHEPGYAAAVAVGT
jgi:holo-[acyl-carrier protein] synthase